MPDQTLVLLLLGSGPFSLGKEAEPEITQRGEKVGGRSGAATLTAWGAAGSTMLRVEMSSEWQQLG
jgi:hypothetical protein